jgi:hypothetical protein
MHTFDKSNMCATQNALELPLQLNAAMLPGQHSVPFEINVLLVYQNAITVGVIEVLALEPIYA